jgi:DNA-binding Lrp family transcriptional regulator
MKTIADDKDALVRSTLARHPEWSDRHIARVCGVCARTVRERRAALEARGAIRRVSPYGRQSAEREAHPSAVMVADPALMAERAAEGLPLTPDRRPRG